MEILVQLLIVCQLEQQGVSEQGKIFWKSPALGTDGAIRMHLPCSMLMVSQEWSGLMDLQITFEVVSQLCAPAVGYFNENRSCLCLHRDLLMACGEAALGQQLSLYKNLLSILPHLPLWSHSRQLSHCQNQKAISCSYPFQVLNKLNSFNCVNSPHCCSMHVIGDCDLVRCVRNKSTLCFSLKVHGTERFIITVTMTVIDN